MRMGTQKLAEAMRICENFLAPHSREISSSIVAHIIDPFQRGLPIPRLSIEEDTTPKDFRQAILPIEMSAIDDEDEDIPFMSMEEFGYRERDAPVPSVPSK